MEKKKKKIILQPHNNPISLVNSGVEPCMVLLGNPHTSPLLDPPYPCTYWHSMGLQEASQIGFPFKKSVLTASRRLCLYLRTQ